MPPLEHRFRNLSTENTSRSLAQRVLQLAGCETHFCLFNKDTKQTFFSFIALEHKEELTLFATQNRATGHLGSFKTVDSETPAELNCISLPHKYESGFLLVSFLTPCCSGPFLLVHMVSCTAWVGAKAAAQREQDEHERR